MPNSRNRIKYVSNATQMERQFYRDGYSKELPLR